MSTAVKAEPIRWRVKSRVEKWSPEDVARVAEYTGVSNPDGWLMEAQGCVPEVVEVDNNMVTTAGLHRITALIIGAGGQAATNTATRLGVGNSSAAVAANQGDLQAGAGAGNRQFYIMDPGYPTQANGVMTFRSTFASADANFAWQEWCIDIGASPVSNGTAVNPLMLNRKVASMGTKVTGSAWTLTVTITLA